MTSLTETVSALSLIALVLPSVTLATYVPCPPCTTGSEAACRDAPDEDALLRTIFAEQANAVGFKFKKSLPDQVQLNFHVNIYALWNIDQKNGEYTWKAEFQVTWLDCRLAFNGSTATGGFGTMIVPPSLGLWHPIWTEETLHKQQTSAVAAEETYILTSFGAVTHKWAEIGTHGCSFDFAKLPFDQQRCTWKLSPINLVSPMAFIEVDPVVLPSGGLKNSHWKISDTFEIASGTEIRAFNENPIPHPLVSVSFTITRKPGYYISCAIVPSVLFWMVSWAGMFITPAAVPARAAVGVIPILILMNLRNAVYAGLPKLSGSFWLDLYLRSINFLLCIHLMEFCYVNFATTLLGKLQARAKKGFSGVVQVTDESSPQGKDEKPGKFMTAVKWSSENLEFYFRILMLLVYFVLNITFLANDDIAE